jgi:tRNA pseudouridine38-40 synthase
MRLALGVEYDGSGFAGWQYQERVRTVQPCLEAALKQIADHPVRVHCAGRTDAGVHAVGQVVHFDSDAIRPIQAWWRGTNTLLPPDLRVLWAKPVPAEFHSRYTAVARTYRYVILNREVRPAIGARSLTWVYRPLDVARMRQAASHLLGEHDFSAFRAQACQSRTPIRRVEHIDVSRYGEYVFVEVRANAFLMHMVRNIVGVLIEIGCGKREPIWAKEVLISANRCLGGVTAPPDGLYLWAVEYPPEFEIPKTGAALCFAAIPLDSDTNDRA